MLPARIDVSPVPRSEPLRSTRLTVFSVICGASVASIYFAHPLLDTMAATFNIAPAVIGVVVTLTQVGYALGLLLIVPLGDLIDCRKLIIAQVSALAVALAAVGMAPNVGTLLTGMVAVGLLAVVVQVIVAFTATLAAPSERGGAVGIVTGGVVIGILAARFVSGTLADLGGWRAVYLTAAALMLGLAAVLVRLLPYHPPPPRGEGYLALLSSMMALFAREPVPRARAFLAFCIFASFSTLWTAAVLPLSAPPLSLSHTAIGAFGLAGAAGVIAAGAAGRLADRGLGEWVTGISLLLLTLSWLAIGQLPRSLVAFVVGAVLLDFAVQAVHVTNQSLIFSVRPEARSRLVGGYMVFYSMGSALGAIASTTVYGQVGWTGVCVVGGSFSAMGLLHWLMYRPAN